MRKNAANTALKSVTSNSCSQLFISEIRPKQGLLNSAGDSYQHDTGTHHTTGSREDRIQRFT
eukprot:scaffold53868_cov47-Attheya_sp.AAC.1